MDSIDTDDISFDVGNDNLAMIGKVITGSSRIHTELLELFASSTRLPPELAATVVGNMDSRALFERSLSVMALRAKMNRKIKLSGLRKDLAKIHRVRNHLAHGDLLGMHKRSGDMLFLVHQYEPDQQHDYLVRIFPYNKEELGELCRIINSVEDRIGMISTTLRGDDEIPN